MSKLILLLKSCQDLQQIEYSLSTDPSLSALKIQTPAIKRTESTIHMFQTSISASTPTLKFSKNHHCPEVTTTIISITISSSERRNIYMSMLILLLKSCQDLQQIEYLLSTNPSSQLKIKHLQSNKLIPSRHGSQPGILC
jgi:hypothetical protein